MSDVVMPDSSFVVVTSETTAVVVLGTSLFNSVVVSSVTAAITVVGIVISGVVVCSAVSV